MKIINIFIWNNKLAKVSCIGCCFSFVLFMDILIDKNTNSTLDSDQIETIVDADELSLAKSKLYSNMSK